METEAPSSYPDFNFSTTPFDLPGPQEPFDVSKWIIVFFFILIVIVTKVGNILVCLSVVLVRKLRKPQNYLLVSLATSDLFVAIFVMPFAIVNEIYQNLWPLNVGLCDLWVSADVLCCTASILNLCAISVDRYRAITRPLEYSAQTTPKRMLAMIFVIWLGSACVSLPPVLLLGNEHTDHNGNPFCSVSQNFWYQIYATCISFYLPLCVMIVVYVKILKVVAAKKREMSTRDPKSSRSSSSSSFPPKALNVNVNGKSSRDYILPINTSSHPKKDKLLGTLREHKASTTLGIIMSAFIICWLPFFVLALVRPFLSPETEVPPWVVTLFLWLGYANSALNPVIYATLNRDFRRPFKEILCFRCRTLDSLMKKEFYNEQFGSDTENLNLRRKASGERSGQTQSSSTQMWEGTPPTRTTLKFEFGKPAATAI